jgi:hypothetical protein
MREVISVHVGQAGVQIGNACCKYYALSGARFPKKLLEKICRSVVFPCFSSFCKLHVEHEADVVIIAGELYTVEHGLSVNRISFATIFTC